MKSSEIVIILFSVILLGISLKFLNYKEIINCNRIDDVCTHTTVNLFNHKTQRVDLRPSEIKDILVEQIGPSKGYFYYVIIARGTQGEERQIINYEFIYRENAQKHSQAIKELFNLNKSTIEYVHTGLTIRNYY